MAAPIIAAGIAGVSSWLGGRQRNKFARNQARKNRAFQERMRNTEWQAGVADMEAAGLNPALAYGQGGASSPSGAVAQMSDAISPAVSSAQEARRLESELKLLETQEMKTYEDAKLAKTSAGESAARTELVYRNQKSVELSNELARLNMFSAKNTAAMEQTSFGKSSVFADRIRRIIFGGSGPGSLLGGAAGAYIGSRGRAAAAETFRATRRR